MRDAIWGKPSSQPPPSAKNIRSVTCSLAPLEVQPRLKRPPLRHSQRVGRSQYGVQIVRRGYADPYAIPGRDQSEPRVPGAEGLGFTLQPAKKAPAVEEPGAGLVEIDDDADGRFLRRLGRDGASAACLGLTQERAPQRRDLDWLAIHVDNEVLLLQVRHRIGAPTRDHDMNQYLDHGHRVHEGLRDSRFRSGGLRDDRRRKHASRDAQHRAEEQPRGTPPRTARMVWQRVPSGPLPPEAARSRAGRQAGSSGCRAPPANKVAGLRPASSSLGLRPRRAGRPAHRHSDGRRLEGAGRHSDGRSQANGQAEQAGVSGYLPPLSAPSASSSSSEPGAVSHSYSMPRT